MNTLISIHHTHLCLLVTPEISRLPLGSHFRQTDNSSLQPDCKSKNPKLYTYNSSWLIPVWRKFKSSKPVACTHVGKQWDDSLNFHCLTQCWQSALENQLGRSVSQRSAVEGGQWRPQTERKHKTRAKWWRRVWEKTFSSAGLCQFY